MKICQQMLEKNLICHASGRAWRKGRKQNDFHFGYKMFAIGSGGKKFPYCGDLSAFLDDFVEIEFDVNSEDSFAAVRIEPSPLKPTDRPEWAHLQVRK